MSETTDKEDEILEEAISYVVAVSRGQRGWILSLQQRG